jgi:acetyltransferase-like isoleucine patch superfamily enzyme
MLSKVIKAFRVRRQRLSRLGNIGMGCEIMETARLYYHQNIKIGSYVRIGHECFLNGEGGLIIEDGAILAAKVTILTSSHCYDQSDYLPFDERDDYRPVHIKAGAWIGFGAMIVPGTIIGEGSVVGMGAVVAGNVGIGQVVVGNPAEVKKERDADWVRKQVAEANYFTRAKFEKRVSRR